MLAHVAEARPSRRSIDPDDADQPGQHPDVEREHHRHADRQPQEEAPSIEPEHEPEEHRRRDAREDRPDQPEATCAEAFDHLPFGGDWQPTLDWFIGNGTNVYRVIEGNYDDWGRKPDDRAEAMDSILQRLERDAEQEATS